MDRRSLLRGGAAVAGGLLSGVPTGAAAETGALDARIRLAGERRTAAIKLSLDKPNTTRARYGLVTPRLLFSKGLQHNSLLTVEHRRLTSLYRAIDNNDFSQVDQVYSSEVPLTNPLACNALADAGIEPVQMEVRPPPTPWSPEFEWEADEMWWTVVCRDVPFSDYPTSAVAKAAAKHLMKGEARENINSLFQPLDRAPLPGPYTSQFLLKRAHLGGVQQNLQGIFTAVNADWMKNFDEFLRIQNGQQPSSKPLKDETVLYPASGRHLANVVHRDFPAQYFMYAAQLLFDRGRAALNKKHPYAKSLRQAGFVSYGLPHCFALLNRAACLALQAAWYYKWRVYRRIRPEEYFGLFHLVKLGEIDLQINTDCAGAEIVRQRDERTGTYLLPQVYPEGSPMHPSYPAGHAAVAGACGLILKCFFKEDLDIASPVEPNTEGTKLNPYDGELAVLGEIDKLVWNISFGRTFAGVHWRSDSVAGIEIGEQVAAALLRESKLFSAEGQDTVDVISFRQNVVRI
jgi:membrane-associated phospholipid phosphatase